MALLITLTMVTLASIMLVTFIAMMQHDKAATASYSQSAKAKNLALGALQVLVEDLRKEMRKDSLPDMGPNNLYVNRPIHTNITSAAQVPARCGTNAAMPSLIRISTNQPAYQGSLYTSLMTSTTLSSTVKSRNGRAITTNRWSKPQLGKFPSPNTTPYWSLITRNGLTNAAGLQFGAAVNGTLNNPTYANTNYVIGRVAYAIYDVGGLLDITVAGHPTSMTPEQVRQIEGTLAGVDLTQLKDSSGTKLIDPDQLVAWRNATTSQSPDTYITHLTSFASTNGFRKTASGDTTFIGRQDLIKAAQSGSVGISTNALPYLTTFSRESGMPTWRPATNAPAAGLFKYKDLAYTTGSTNRFVPLVRVNADDQITSYHSDGTRYMYKVVAGDPVVRKRFPLERLKWLTRNGPKAGVGAEAIRACFGLEWSGSNITPGAKVWKYVGSSSSSAKPILSTLDQIAAESPRREPNFFELIQAGILTGSLGYYGGANQQLDPKTYELKSTLQICRIAANIIDQYDDDSYPTVIECPVYSVYYQICGVENLPQVNVFKTICAIANSGASLSFYSLPGLWNPHQNAGAISGDIPKVRLSFGGTIMTRCNWATTLQGNPSSPEGIGIYGETTTVPFSPMTNIQLRSDSPGRGARGFAEATLVAAEDVSGTLSGGSASGGAWEKTPPLGGANTVLEGKQYVGLRLKDMPLELTTLREGIVKVLAGSNKPSDFPQTTGYADLTPEAKKTLRNKGEVVTRMTDGQVLLEFEQNPGVWVPYSFLFGMNTADRSTWVSDPTKAFNSGHNPWRKPTFPNDVDLTLLANAQQVANGMFDQVDVWGENGSLHYQKIDPLTIRIIPAIFVRWLNGNTSSSNAAGTPQARNVGFKPLWSTAPLLSNLPGASDESKFATSGYGGADWNQTNASGIEPRTTANPQMQGVPANIANKGANSSYFPATLCRNSGKEIATNSYSGNTVIKDPDGIARLADSGLYGSPSDQGPGLGNPYLNSKDRPIHLDRPFQSLVELGKVLRDNPWRTLNFFTEDSPDSGLLELFCLYESSENEPTSGRLDLNTRNATVLAVALSNTTTQPADIAKSWVTFTDPANTAQGPLSNKSDLVVRLFHSSDGLADFKSIKLKSERENLLRTLANLGQVGTWNLMIDLVAQTGKYPPDATRLEDFIVEGEQRYWLHIAINRVTEQIIDQQLEIITE